MTPARRSSQSSVARSLQLPAVDEPAVAAAAVDQVHVGDAHVVQLANCPDDAAHFKAGRSGTGGAGKGPSGAGVHAAVVAVAAGRSRRPRRVHDDVSPGFSASARPRRFTRSIVRTGTSKRLPMTRACRPRAPSPTTRLKPRSCSSDAKNSSEPTAQHAHVGLGHDDDVRQVRVLRHERLQRHPLLQARARDRCRSSDRDRRRRRGGRSRSRAACRRPARGRRRACGPGTRRRRRGPRRSAWRPRACGERP